ncbi:MAG: hypothetical protein ABI363_08705, partial [Nitrosospira sp.]
KPRVADQDNVAGMTRINPFVDDRGYMINVVIMTEKKKSFHVRILERVHILRRRRIQIQQ